MSEIIDNWKTILHTIAKTSIPMMLAQFIMTMSGFVAALILAYVSTEVFAASMLISSLQLFIIIVPYALFFCIGPIVSQILGSKQNLDQIGVIFRSASLAGIYISIILMVILWFIKPILLILGQPANLAVITEQYFRAFLWSLPAIAIMRVILQILNGLFKQQVALLFGFLSFVLSSLLGYMMVFGKWGAPALGVAGLAWGYVIQAYFLDIVLLIYLSTNKIYQIYRFYLWDKLSTIYDIQKKLFQIGGPIILQMGNELGSFFITTLMVGWLGATALIAKQITARYLMLIVVPLFGLSQAASLFVGKSFGEKSLTKVSHYFHAILWMGLIYSFVILLIFLVIPKPFIDIFINPDEVGAHFLKLVSILLVLAALGQVFDTIRNVCTGALRGFNDTQYAMWVSFACVWPIGLILSYLFGFTFHWGLIGISVAHIIASLVSAIILYIRWRSVLNIKKNATELSYVSS